MYVQLLSSCAMLRNVPVGSTPGRKAIACMSFASRTSVRYLFHMPIWSMFSETSISLACSSRIPSWNCRSKWEWMSRIASVAFVNVGDWRPVSVTPCCKNLYLCACILGLNGLDKCHVTIARLLLTLASFWQGVTPWYVLHHVQWISLLPSHCRLPLASQFAMMLDLWIVVFCSCPKSWNRSMHWFRYLSYCMWRLLTLWRSAKRICSSLPVNSTALCSISFPVFCLFSFPHMIWIWTHAIRLWDLGFPCRRFRLLRSEGVASSTNRWKCSEWFCVSFTHVLLSRVYLFEPILSITFCRIQWLSRCHYSLLLLISVSRGIYLFIFSWISIICDSSIFTDLSIFWSVCRCLCVIVRGPLSLLVNLRIFYCIFVMLILCHQFCKETPACSVHNLKLRSFVSEVRMWGSFPWLGSAVCCTSPGPWVSLCSSSGALIPCNILGLVCLCGAYHCHLFPDVSDPHCCLLCSMYMCQSSIYIFRIANPWRSFSMSGLSVVAFIVVPLISPFTFRLTVAPS